MSLLPVDGMTLRTIFFAVFVLSLIYFLYRDREEMRRHTVIFFRRTQKGINAIDRITDRFPRFWKFYANSGVLVAGLSIFVSLGMVGYMVYNMVVSQSASGGPSLILPGLVAENQFQAGVSFIPVEYWVIGIGVLMVAHELSHGIVARLEDFELNSVGWGVMAIIPFAFVEPKGEQMLPGAEAEGDSSGHWNQGSWKSQLRVLCAGSFANYVVGAIFFLFAFALAGSAMVPGSTGVLTEFSDVIYVAQDDYPSAKAGLDNGTLQRVEGERIEGIDDLRQIMEGVNPGENVTLQTSEGNFTVTTVSKEDHEGGYLGLLLGKETVIKDKYSAFKSELRWFVSMLFTISILNIFIGLFNMLPAKPLDGGWAVDTVIKRFLGEGYARYLNGFSLLIWTAVATALLVSIIGI